MIERHRILKGIREFFWARGFLEVETPVLLAHPSQEPYLEPLRTTVCDARGHALDAFLRMSPEFSLKKLIATIESTHDSEPTHAASRTHSSARPSRGVFEIGPVFRDGEPWGATHNPEFTMLEWYEVGAAYHALLESCEALVRALHPAPMLSYQGQMINLASPWERLTMREAWKRYAGLDLDALLSRDAMADACAARDHSITASDTFDDCFFKMFLSEIEPRLGRERPTFLTEWPSQMAALARTREDDPRYAERVELYVGGLELANGFSELTDAAEQRERFVKDNALRRALGRPVYPMDEAFLEAVGRMPETAGIALGVDRLVMFLVDAATIDEVRWLPARTLWHR